MGVTVEYLTLTNQHKVDAFRIRIKSCRLTSVLSKKRPHLDQENIFILTRVRVRDCIMNLTQHKVKVMNIGLTKSATILADSFVDLKRKAASQLYLSGWLEVKVYKAEDFEDVTHDMVSDGA